jgi:hypothetical protein
MMLMMQSSSLAQCSLTGHAAKRLLGLIQLGCSTGAMTAGLAIGAHRRPCEASSLRRRRLCAAAALAPARPCACSTPGAAYRPVTPFSHDTIFSFLSVTMPLAPAHARPSPTHTSPPPLQPHPLPPLISSLPSPPPLPSRSGPLAHCLGATNMLVVQATPRPPSHPIPSSPTPPPLHSTPFTLSLPCSGPLAHRLGATNLLVVQAALLVLSLYPNAAAWYYEVGVGGRGV